MCIYLFLNYLFSSIDVFIHLYANTTRSWLLQFYFMSQNQVVLFLQLFQSCFSYFSTFELFSYKFYNGLTIFHTRAFKEAWYNFDCPIFLAKIFSMMLNGSDKTRHPGLLPNLRWETFLINYDISCRLIVDAIYPVKTAIFYSQYTKNFVQEWILYLIWSFYYIYWKDHTILNAILILYPEDIAPVSLLNCFLVLIKNLWCSFLFLCTCLYFFLYLVS